MIRKTVATAILVAALGLLAGCDSAEERAEKHYQSGLELLAAGDVERALVEFRNVFKLNGLHKEARLTYANTERARGNLGEAYSQYLRLVEQYPDNLDGQRALAEIAAQSGDWEETERHVTAALGIAPDDLPSQAVQILMTYGLAAEQNDTAAMDKAAADAAALLAKLPDSLLLHSAVIDHAVRNQQFGEALRLIDRAIAAVPEERSLHAARISTYAAQGDNAGVESSILAMMKAFPGDPSVERALVRWYVSQDEIAKAEDFMRSRIDPAAPDLGAALELVRFISDYRGLEPALAEVEARIAAGATSPAMLAARAGLRFDLGDRDAAIAEMEALIAEAEPSDETRRTKIGLARMLIVTGNATGARALVEEVLAEDGSDVEALKLKANWLIQDDEIGEAINLLRAALDQSPRDADAMTLMAQAYERDGNRDLMRDSLAMAVEASGRAPDESLRYARLLMSEDNPRAAETVLIDALRLAPKTAALLLPLGQIYVAMEDWGRTDAVADELESIGDPQAATAAAGLRAAALAGQEKTDQALAYLEDLADKGEGGLATRAAIVRSHLASGRTDEALAYAQRILAENPSDPDLRFLMAYVHEATGNPAEAETIYRGLLAEDRAQPQVWMALYRAVSSDPARLADAGEVIDEALAANPDSAELKWARAGLLERQGDVDGAIAVYEDLYAENSANMIVANNLASLLSTHRTDQASLDRAELIARRLRGSTVPAYQDTYGWIAYLRGNHAEAAAELEKAAAGLPGDPAVQYHLGMAYLALARNAEALAQFDKAIALTAENDTRPFVAKARDEAAKLRAQGVEAIR